MWSVLSTSIWQGSISQISLLHMARTYRVARNINMSHQYDQMCPTILWHFILGNTR
jgi:hypothetical protein